MLRQYERVEARIRNEIDSEVGARLGPALFVFHLQLILRDWFEDQTRTGQTSIIPAPDFGLQLETFERHNNINRLPSVSNVPALLALRPSAPSSNHTTRAVAAAAAPTAIAATVARGFAPVGQRPDLCPRFCNTGRDTRVTGNTAFATHVRLRRVEEAILLAGCAMTAGDCSRWGVGGNVRVLPRQGLLFEGVPESRVL